MKPIDELSESLAASLKDIVLRQHELDSHGQKVLLDALRKLLIATHKLNTELLAMTHRQASTDRRRPTLYLVK